MISRWSRVCATSTASSAPSRARPAGTACRALRASPSRTSSRSTTTPTCSATCRVSASSTPVSYTHLRAHETRHDLVCRLLLEKKKKNKNLSNITQQDNEKQRNKNKHTKNK